MKNFFSSKSKVPSAVTQVGDDDMYKLQSNLEKTKFLLACEQGDIYTLRCILLKYDETELEILLNDKDEDTNKTGLIYACIGGHKAVVMELVNNGADIEKCYDGSTPLYCACSRGHIEIAEFLLNHNANANAINLKGWTPLMNAAYFGRSEIVELLLKYSAETDVVRSQFDGKSALHFACKNGRYKVVELLLQFGANPNISDNCNGTTPLMYASKSGYNQICQILILYGADPLITNSEKKMAIDFVEFEDENDDNKEYEEDSESISMSQQKFFYLLMQKSVNIHSALSKLIYLDKMRVTLKKINILSSEYPKIMTKIENIESIHQLFMIDNTDFNDFKQHSFELRKNLKNLRPYNKQSESNKDGDCNDSYELVLESFNFEMMASAEKYKIAKQNEMSNKDKMKKIENEITSKQQKQHQIAQQIALLQKELASLKNDEILLKKEFQQRQTKQNKLHSNIESAQQTKIVDDEMYAMMSKATENIKSVCDNAEKLPSKYRSELIKSYESKKRLLEEKWREWTLKDIIAWICSLDLKGRFKKYKERLLKLSELEDGYEDDEELDYIDEYDLSSLLDDDDMDEEEGNYDEKYAKKNNVEKKERNVSIIELINDTVLKMCGIHDSKDRNVIMLNIEALMKSNYSLMPNEGHLNVEIDDDYKDIKDDDLISMMSPAHFSDEQSDHSDI